MSSPIWKQRRFGEFASLGERWWQQQRRKGLAKAARETTEERARERRARVIHFEGMLPGIGRYMARACPPPEADRGSTQFGDRTSKYQRGKQAKRQRTSGGGHG